MRFKKGGQPIAHLEQLAVLGFQIIHIEFCHFLKAIYRYGLAIPEIAILKLRTDIQPKMVAQAVAQILKAITF